MARRTVSELRVHAQLRQPAEIASAVPPDFAADFQEALYDFAKGIRRPKKIKDACKRRDRIREENCGLFGK
jgi:hypothetical protein